jgi:hypothetical protein
VSVFLSAAYKPGEQTVVALCVFHGGRTRLFTPSRSTEVWPPIAAPARPQYLPNRKQSFQNHRPMPSFIISPSESAYTLGRGTLAHPVRCTSNH